MKIKETKTLLHLRVTEKGLQLALFSSLSFSLQGFWMDWVKVICLCSRTLANINVYTFEILFVRAWHVTEFRDKQ